MAGASDECWNRVIAASQLENEAIELDRKGDVPGAVHKYEAAEKELAKAIDLALPAHAEDQPKLRQHRQEILDRISHLKSLSPGQAPSIPLEDQIKAVQLGMRGATVASDAVAAGGGVKTMAAVAALGAAGGFVVLGATVGTSLSVIGGAAAASYCATRSDKVGDVARGAGGLAVKGVEKAVELNEKHKVTEKLTEAGQTVAARAKETNDKYKITDKIGGAVNAAVSKAQQVEEKHHVTDRAASALSRGFSKVTSMLDKRPSSAASSGAPPAGGAAPQ